MTQRSIQPQILKATSPDVPAALLSLTIAALVLVLITVQTGAGVGFA